MPRIDTNRREAARKQIIAAALDVAATRGWDAVTLDAIARRVGVTKGALYSYFESREVLLRAVIFEVFQNICAPIGETLAREKNVRQTLRNLADLVFEQPEVYANLFFQLPMRMIQDQESQKEFSTILGTSWGLIRDYLAQAQADGTISPEVDPREATDAMMMMLVGVSTGSRMFGRDTNYVKNLWIVSMERILLLEPAGDQGQ